MMQGVDVSHHQNPTRIDWKKFCDQGIRFAVARASYGTSPDGAFQQHVRNAISVGIFAGAYHFLRFKSSQSARAQAETFLESLEPVSAFLDQMLPPTLDLEDNRYDEPIRTASDKRKYLSMVNEWLEIVEKRLGRNAIIYTRANFFDDTFEPTSQFGIRPLWIAHYTTRPSPNIPDAWNSHTIWQYTEHGRLNGYNDRLDLNRFDGDEADIANLIAGRKFIETDFDLRELDPSFTPLGDSGFPVERVNSGGLNLRSEPRVSTQTWIATLPLAHDVEVLERNINTKWAKIRTKYNGQGVTGFVAQTYLRRKKSEDVENLVSAAAAEWLRFRRGAGKETVEPYYQYIGEMWQARGWNLTGKDTDWPWSAAAISFFVEKAGPAYDGFLKSIRHSDYIKDAIEKREAGEVAPFWAYRLNEQKPEIGDLVCQWRERAVDYDGARMRDRFDSHTDVIVRVEQDRIFAMGGNVGNSVNMSEFRLDANGKLKVEGKLFALMKNRL